jgi:hypothetical protein
LITSPRSQLSDHPAGLRLGRWLELRSRLDQGLVSGRRLGRGNRVDRGGSLIFGVRAALGLGPLAGERCDHCGDGSVFKVGWRLDVRGKVPDDLADVAVLVDDTLAVAAAGGDGG